MTTECLKQFHGLFLSALFHVSLEASINSERDKSSRSIDNLLNEWIFESRNGVLNDILDDGKLIFELDIYHKRIVWYYNYMLDMLTLF